MKLPEVGALVRKALTERDLRRENRELRQAVEARYSFGELLGKSAVMQRLFGLLERLAATSDTVLIQGESGTGKELVARALHYQSPRRRHPFVPVNCAAMPEGCSKASCLGMLGAFTGRRSLAAGCSSRPRGAPSSSEIGDMPWECRPSSCGCWNSARSVRSGATAKFVDVRVLAAAHRDLASAVQQGTFREDLYYRLRVMPVQVPPLREHREDIPFLAETFLQRHVAAHR